jgi:hypothetical protein
MNRRGEPDGSAVIRSWNVTKTSSVALNVSSTYAAVFEILAEPGPASGETVSLVTVPEILSTPWIGSSRVGSKVMSLIRPPIGGGGGGGGAVVVIVRLAVEGPTALDAVRLIVNVPTVV